MVWYGMVWYGMVWYGMVWYGMVWYGMVWYGMVWYGMDSLNVRCAFVHKCTAPSATSAQCALASAPASVRPDRGAPVTAASHGAPYRSKTCLAHASAGSCRHRRCRRGDSTKPKRLEPSAVVEAADVVVAAEVATSAVVAAVAVTAAVVAAVVVTAAVIAAAVVTAAVVPAVAVAAAVVATTVATAAVVAAVVVTANNTVSIALATAVSREDEHFTPTLRMVAGAPGLFAKPSMMPGTTPP